MILVVGGQGQGKLAWVLEHLGYTLDDVTETPGSGRPVLDNLERHVDGLGDAPFDAVPARLLAHEVVVCDEVGCGLVPVDADQRRRRELVGRLCCALALEATAVVRVTCGIGQPIKGSLPRLEASR